MSASDEGEFFVFDSADNDAEPLRIVVFGPTRFRRSLVVLVMTEATEQFWAGGKF